MKKNFLKLFVLVTMVAFVTACSESKTEKAVKEYENACAAGDTQTAQQIKEQLDVMIDKGELTEEQLDRIEQAKVALYWQSK